MINRKKAVSEMIAYVLLIVIAISISVVVYAVLNAYIPREAEKCPDDVRLIIQDYTCSGDIFNLTVKNQGLHSVDGMYVHISNQSGKPAAFPLDEKGNPGTSGEIFFSSKLNASDSKTFAFDYSKYNLIIKISIKPFRTGKTLVLCDAVTMQDINCNPAVIPETPACTLADNCTWSPGNCCADGFRSNVAVCNAGCESLETSICNIPDAVCAASVPSALTLPVSWWKFAGTGEDALGDNDLTLTTGTGYDAGKVGLALSVLGTSAYTKINPVTSSSSLKLTGNLSLEAWIKVGTLSNTFTTAWIVRERNSTTTNYGLRIENITKNILFYYGGNIVARSSNSITDDGLTWYHIAGIKNGTNFKLYINNVNVGTGSLDTVPVYGAEDYLYVGWLSSGQIALTDEVAIYNRTLTEAEINIHYLNSSAGRTYY